MRTATPKKSDEGNSSAHPEIARFDPIDLQKERIGEESEGKQRQKESWHSFSTF
jgi:hypothetical protein